MTTFTGFHVSAPFAHISMARIIERLTIGTANNIMFLCNTPEGEIWLQDPDASQLVRRASIYDRHVVIAVCFDHEDDTKIAAALQELGHDGIPCTELRTCAEVG
ncbi:MAG: hypothetical protein PVI21_02885 [Candidatus Woesebacteria bacterium]|jgi:hypothetical protein